MARPDLVTVIEALYAVDLPERDWLTQVAGAIETGLRTANVGAYALTYDASDIHDCRFSAFAATARVAPELARVLEFDFSAFYRRTPPLVDAILRHVSFAPSRELPMVAEIDFAHDALARFGVHEILGINGVNVDGRGMHGGLLVARRAPTSDPEPLARVSSHMAAASRLRRRLAGAPSLSRADAVIDAATGKVAHAARGAELREARQALGTAARRLDALRGPLGRRDPARAARQWKALVEGHWSLVDHFDTDGRRYVLAQSNENAVVPLALLSERELQVVALAAIGHANKMIAYELGIAISTVGVLLGRAARKLRARTRRDLVAAYVSATSGDVGVP